MIVGRAMIISIQQRTGQEKNQRQNTSTATDASKTTAPSKNAPAIICITEDGLGLGLCVMG